MTTSNAVHAGYTDGLMGHPINPNPGPGKFLYEHGYHKGQEDREAGKVKSRYYGRCDNTPFKPGDRVIIPKGVQYIQAAGHGSEFRVATRNMEVVVDCVYCGCDAILFQGKVHPPVSPIVCVRSYPAARFVDSNDVRVV